MSDFNPTRVKPPISFSELEKIDIRTGTIYSVDDVPNSNKLVKLSVDFGDHTRIIVVGMKKERSNPKEIIGKQALFVVNLPKKTIMNIESEGMLFDIGYSDGLSPVLAVTEKNISNGVRAG